MRLNVYDLTLKLIENRADVVVFVGKKIWDIYESVTTKTAGNVVAVRPDPAKPLVKLEQDDEGVATTLPEIDADIKLEADPGSPLLPVKEEAAQAPPESEPVISGNAAKTKRPTDWTQPRALRLPHARGYTYFWVTPNTSGLERTPVSLCGADWIIYT